MSAPVPLPPDQEAGDFASLYCQHRGLLPAAYHRAVLRRTLYPHARLLAPLLLLIDSDHFAADHDFVEGVGRIRSRSEFGVEADEFAHHPANRDWWRRVLRLRASIGRMRRVLDEIFDRAADAASIPSGTGTVPPIPVRRISPRP